MPPTVEYEWASAQFSGKALPLRGKFASFNPCSTYNDWSAIRTTWPRLGGPVMVALGEERNMPEGIQIADRHGDPYAWALSQVAIIRSRTAQLKNLDRDGLGQFLEEWADEMLSSVRSQIVNLMAHAAKVAFSRNPEVVGHWRSECIEFHDRIVDGYRPSMRDKIDMSSLWRRATRKVMASFDDYREARPPLPAASPFRLEDVVAPDADLDRLVELVRQEPSS
jgi:hypothetical protein